MEKIDEIWEKFIDQNDPLSGNASVPERSIWKCISYDLVSISIHLIADEVPSDEEESKRSNKNLAEGGSWSRNVFDI